MSTKQPARQQPQNTIDVVENPNVLTSYANLVAGIEFDGANFTILFAHQRIAGIPQQSEQGAVARQGHVTSRVTMTPAAAADLANKLAAMMKQMVEMQKQQQAQSQAQLADAPINFGSN